MAPAQPGEPRPSPKPQPIGNMVMIVLFTTCTMCALFLLWRRSDALRRVVSHQMKTWTRTEGGVRLSEDDGPAATEFLGDDLDEDGDDGIEWDNRDRELPAERGRKLTTGFARPIDGDIGGAPT